MQPLHHLASQTVIYGISSIAGRFLNYLLVPLYTYYFAPAEYGIIAELYAYMGFLTVVLLLGLETGYFRFRVDETWDSSLVYATTLRTVLGFNAVFLITILFFLTPLANIMRYAEHPEYLMWMTLILSFDAIGAVAFARLRAEQQAFRFAGIKLLEIMVNIILNLIFISLYRDVGYVLIANLVASGLKLLLLKTEFISIKSGFNWKLFQEMLRYSLPMVLIGLAGIINEMLDRVVLKFLLPYDAVTNMAQLGIYSACYKLSIVMSLFIQAFRYAGEPFFFSISKQADAKQMYATILNYFVIFCVLIFLIVTLYIDFFKYFIGSPYRVGLPIIPILLLANLFLGIYVNLSIWYKLSDRTMLGAYVSAIGAVITLMLLLWWVPIFGYMGAAWATLVCYFSMALGSYILSRRYYPIPYDVWGVIGYILLGLAIYGGHTWLVTTLQWSAMLVGTVGIIGFMLIVLLLKKINFTPY